MVRIETAGYTPLLLPALAAGVRLRMNVMLQLVLASLRSAVELIYGDGSVPYPWPEEMAGATFLASPALHDGNGDGIQASTAAASEYKNTKMSFIRISSVESALLIMIVLRVHSGVPEEQSVGYPRPYTRYPTKVCTLGYPVPHLFVLTLLGCVIRYPQTIYPAILPGYPRAYTLLRYIVWGTRVPHVCFGLSQVCTRVPPDYIPY